MLGWWMYRSVDYRELYTGIHRTRVEKVMEMG